MRVMCFDSIFSFWISVFVIKKLYHELVACDNFISLPECCDFQRYALLGSVWRVPSWASEVPSLADIWYAGVAAFLQETWVQAFTGSLRVTLRKPVPLMLAFLCRVCVLHFIRLNKLINSADLERLHNLSSVNSHLNYPNFILNLQNPITS